MSRGGGVGWGYRGVRVVVMGRLEVLEEKTAKSVNHKPYMA